MKRLALPHTALSPLIAARLLALLPILLLSLLVCVPSHSYSHQPMMSAPAQGTGGATVNWLAALSPMARADALTRGAPLIDLLTKLPGQTQVGTITQPGMKPRAVAVYEAGNAIFVADHATGNLYKYNATTLVQSGFVFVGTGVWRNGLVVDETTGKVFAASHDRQRVAVVNGADCSLIQDLAGTYTNFPRLAIDSGLGKVWALSLEGLRQIDIALLTETTVAGLGGGGAEELAVNTVTHKAFVTRVIPNTTVIVDGGTLGTTTVAAMGGSGIEVNTVENKVVVATGSGGAGVAYKIYDVDTAGQTNLSGVNDALNMVFNPTTNRMHTTSEVNRYSTILNGATDEWVNIPLLGGSNGVGVRNATGHAFHAFKQFIAVLDEATETVELIPVTNPTPSSSNLYQDVAINQTTGRVFVIPDGDALNSVIVIDDTTMLLRPPVYLASVGSSRIHVYDPVSDTVVNTVTPPPGTLGDIIAVRPGGGRYYAGRINFFDPELGVYAGAGSSALLTFIDTGANNNDAPRIPAARPSDGRIYATRGPIDDVVVIDPVSNSVVTSIAVGDNPKGLAFTPDGAKLYVPNQGSNNVSVINTATNTVSTTIAAGTAPYGVVLLPNGRKAYVANSTAGTVSVINTATDTVSSTVTVGTTPHWLAVSPDGKRVYVGNRGGGSVSVIDTSNDSVTTPITGLLNPEGIGVLPDNSKVYVVNSNTSVASSLTVINPVDYSTTNIPLPSASVTTIGVAVTDPTSRFAGRVTNSSGGAAISGALVRALQSSVEKGTATTNAAGDYSVFNLLPGTYDLEVSAVGFTTQSQNAQAVGAGRTEVRDFALTPVSLPDTTTSVIADDTSVTAGDLVTFTATVSSGSPGTITGTVQFKAGGNNLGSPVTLSGGQAQLMTRCVTIGSHTITAVYSGDSNFNGSTGTMLGNQSVVKPSSVQVDDSFAGSADCQDLGGGNVFNRNAFATIAAGQADVTPGGTVNIAEGTYTENVTVTNETFTLSGNVQISGSLTLAGGTFNSTSGTLSITGNFTHNGGTFNHNLGTVALTGGAPQSLGGTLQTSFRNLTIGNAAVVSLGVSKSVGGVLALGSNILSTGANTLTVVGSVTRTSGYIIGNERRNFMSAGAHFFTFDVGTANGYSPVDATVSVSASGSNSVMVTAVQGAQPDVDSAISLQRYWTLASSFVGSGTADLAFHYLQGDVMGNEAAYQIIRMSGGIPTPFINNCPGGPCVNILTNTATTNGVSTFSDWTLGEPDPVDTTTTVIADDTSVIAADLVTFTVNVSSSASGGTITGTVQIKEDGTNVGAPGTVSGGQAQIMTRCLTIGSHTITAVYSGDPNFNSSTGTMLGNQSVVKPSSVQVDDSFAGSSDCQDLGGGLTFNRNAFATIAAAQSGVAVGGTVNIAEGTYAESVTVTNETFTLSGNVQISGSLTLAGGTFNSTSGTLSITGNFTHNGGTFNHNLGTVALTGGAPQSLGGTLQTSFRNLTIGNAAVVSLGVSKSVGGVLALGSNILSTGANTLTVVGSVTRTSGYIIGNERRNFMSAGAHFFTFDVGTANGYSPVDATVNVSSSGSNSLTVKAVQGQHPNIGGANALQRYWTLGNSFVGTGSADLTFHYLATDVVGTEANYKIFKYDGVFTQFNPDVLNTTSHFATKNGISSFSDWMLAEASSALPDLVLTKTDFQDPVTEGNSLTYSITVTNNSDIDASNVTLFDTLPANVTFVSTSGGCSESSGTVTCNIGSLAAHASVVKTITVTPTHAAAVAGSISNTATVTSSEGDANPADNSDTEPTQVIAAICTSAPSNLLSWYAAENNASDRQGANNGTIQGATFTTGKVGQGFSFDGVDDSVNVPASSSLNPPTQQTLDAWIRPTDLSSGNNQGIIAKQDPGFFAIHKFLLQLNPDGHVYYSVMQNLSNVASVTSTSVVPLNTWTFVAATFDGATLRLYINGQEEGSAPFNSNPNENSYPVTIGSDNRGGYFKGDIDEAEIFIRALSGTEILDLFNAGSAGKCVCTVPPLDIVSWWRAENNALDERVTNNGTLNGDTTFAAGKVGQAFSLDAAGDYVEVADHPSLDFTPGITVDAWIYPTASGGIVTKADNEIAATSWFLEYDLANQRVNFGLTTTSSATTIVSSNGSVPPNTWSHVAGTSDGATMKLYVNGLQASSDASPAVPQNNFTLLIGAFQRLGVKEQFYGGRLDEVEVFNRALAASEVAAIYSAGSAGKCLNVNDAPVNTVPGPQTINEDTDLSFSTGGGNAISTSDIDAGTNQVQMTLSTTNGRVTLSTIAGLDFSFPGTMGDGTLDTLIITRGTIAAINNALNGLMFRPNADFSGAAGIQLTINDLGNTGTDPGYTGDVSSEEDSDDVNITVNPVTDPDVTVAVSPAAVGEDGATNLDYIFTRSDSAGSLIVNFSISGTATRNVDYTQTGATTFGTISGSVTFNSGESTKTVTVNPTADATYEANETLILMITDGSAYNVGSPNAATGVITNDDAPPTTLVVNTTNDVDDGFCDATHCSLREAINAANFSSDASTINFNIPNTDPGFAGGVFTIQPTPTALPTITSPVTIDGKTQPGFGGTPIVELNGVSVTGNGLRVSAGNSSIKGLVINRFDGAGIVLESNGGNTVECNYIGTNPAGTASLGNLDGILITAPNNTIGGIAAGAGNLISGNNQSGLFIQGTSAAGNFVQGNFIGVDATGTSALGNSSAGVGILGSSSNTIGGTTSNARNIISGNTGAGVNIGGGNTGNLVQGNFIGTDVNGTAAIGNSLAGVVVNSGSSGCTVGGTTIGARNVISGNGDTGVSLGAGASANFVQGNFIGTDVNGAADLGNASSGVFSFGPNNTIGGGSAGAGNVISGNEGAGVFFSGSLANGNQVLGNYIGTNSAGTAPLGNTASGIFIALCNSNTIGGTAAGMGNTIAFNGGDGAFISGTGNAIRGNSIYSNGDLGIDLAPNGVAANDAGDSDSGANNLQNFPVLTSAGSSSGTTTITGSLNSAPGTSFTLDFYVSAGCDSSGNGEGETYIGSTNVTTDGSGNTSFVVSFPASIPAGQVITATATDPAGNTSEFSACSLVSAGLMIPAGSYSTVTIASGTTVTLTGDVSITGQLTLNGDLDTGGFTLTMPAGAITTGNGDVIGNVRRTGFVIGTALSFGNPFNTIRFDSGTPPTEVTMNLVKSAPVSFPNAVERTYTITPVGGSGYSATLQLHYVDTELNGNSEATLEFWRHNGTVWAGQGVTTGDATDNWVNLVGVTLFSPWVIAGPGGPTAIELASFAATGYDSGVFIEWKTGLETDNLGFNIYRDHGGRRALVNSQLVAGSALKDGASLRAGESYAWWDGGIAGCELRIADCKNVSYWLEDIDLKRASTWHGPFGVNRVGGAPPSRSNAALISKLGSNHSEHDSTRVVGLSAPLPPGSSAQPGVQSDLASQPAVKISVSREAWYRVTQPELVAAGLNPKIDSRFLQLLVAGREVPIYVSTGKDGAFDAASSIEFYGQGLDTPSTDVRTYWLIVSAQDGKRIGQFKTAGAASSAHSFTQTVERKDRMIYFSALRNGDKENFFGSIVAGSGVDQTLSLTHLAQFDTSDFETTLEVVLQGVTVTPHRVLVQLNGVGVREIIFNGQDRGVSTFNIDHSLLREGENTLRLVPQNGASDISLVDHIRVGYQHSFTADDDTLKFTANGGQQVAIDGFSSRGIRVFDVTDASSLQELIGDVSPSKNGFSVAVAPREPGLRTLIALTDEKASDAASVEANSPSTWRSPANSADFVIITPGDLLPAIEPLKVARQAEGYRVALIDVADIYDEFNFGHKSPQAIRDFLAHAKATWKLAPRFVLFAGDASFDGKNYLGHGDNDLVPTKLIDTDFLETASDDWFADFNNDGVSDLAVGRLPVRSVQEAATVVSKLLRYSQSKPCESIALVSDANDGFNFEQASTQLRALLPSILKVEEIKRGELDPATARMRLVDAINRGQKLVNYTGHGSANQWRGDLLSSEAARALTNGGRLPVFMMMTCLNGFFHEAALDSLAESLIKAEHGGAVAVWASSGMTFPDQQATINRELYRLLFGAGGGSVNRGAVPTLGEATRRAKLAVSDSDVRRTWVLLGDPTMRLR